MTRILGFFALVLTVLAPSLALANPVLLYDNTTTDTGDTLFYSVGPYTGIGDQIHLSQQLAAGDTSDARVQMYNNGEAGTFDAQLEFYDVGAPVGSLIDSPFTLTGLSSAGSDILDLTFNLGDLVLPQDVIFVARVNNVTAGMDLGLDLFEPPTVGSSDNSFLIVDSGGFTQALSPEEDVYFQVDQVPEPASLLLLGTGLVVAGTAARWRRTRG